MTTQVRPAAAARVFATASVVVSTNVLADSGNSFTSADVGKTVTTANVPGGTTISSITDAGHAVMSANATLSSGPQSCTLTQPWANVTLDSVSCVLASTVFGQTMLPGAVCLAIFALELWRNAAGAGDAGITAADTLAAVGLSVQEV